MGEVAVVFLLGGWTLAPKRKIENSNLNSSFLPRSPHNWTYLEVFLRGTTISCAENDQRGPF